MRIPTKNPTYTAKPAGNTAKRAGSALVGLAMTLTGVTAVAGPAAADPLGPIEIIAELPPQASPMATPAANANGWHNNSFDIIWNWVYSGEVDPAQCDLGPTPVTGAGVSTITGTCTDEFGQTTTESIEARIDRLAPDTALTPYSIGDEAVVFSGTDDMSLGAGQESGIDRFECAIDFTDDYSPCESPIATEDFRAGSTPLHVRAVDRAGNVDAFPAFTYVDVLPTDLPSGSTTIDGVRFSVNRKRDLTITGTNEVNNLFISEDVKPGEISVGIDNDGLDSLVWSGPVRKLRINTRSGNDEISFSGVDLAGDVVVNAGNGRNSLGFYEADFGGKLIVKTGTAPEGEGSDIGFWQVKVAKSLSITGGRGPESMSIVNSTIDGKLSIKPGAGRNIFSTSNSTMGSFDYRGLGGRDQVAIEEDVDLGSRPRISTDGGGDQVELIQPTFSGRFSVNTGADSDSFDLRGADNMPALNGGTLKLTMGSGDDFAFLGAGLTSASSANGGSGEDLYGFTGPNDIVLKSFELTQGPN